MKKNKTRLPKFDIVNMRKESVNYKCKYTLILELFFDGKHGFGGH